MNLGELNTGMQAAFGSSYINNFVNGNRVQRVIMQLDAPYRMVPDDIGKLYVRTTSGTMTPISTFTGLEWIFGASCAAALQRFPLLRNRGAAPAGKSTGEAMDAMEEMAKKLPSGFGFEWTGQSYEERLSGSQAPLLYAISLIVVFLCLAALYESWSIPLAVILVVPLGIVGALLLTTLRGLPNDVYFKVGLLTIVGLSTKNAILIIEFAKELMEDGKSLVDATLEAVHLRLRPILMTSMAFVLGVTPLAISTGAGSASQNAIGTGVIGGMLTGTLLAIFLVPVFFFVVMSLFKRSIKVKSKDDKPAAIAPAPERSGS